MEDEAFRSTRAIIWILQWSKYRFSKDIFIINTQGVLKLRKRVTLMIVAVSIIFGICWGVDQVVYTLKLTANFNVGPIPTAIANTMVLFNSAVNPFVYALLNKQFREKMKRMLCCIGSSTHRVHPAHEPQTMELANNQQPAGPHSSTTECLHEIMFSSKDGVKWNAFLGELHSIERAFSSLLLPSKRKS